MKKILDFLERLSCKQFTIIGFIFISTLFMPVAGGVIFWLAGGSDMLDKYIELNKCKDKVERVQASSDFTQERYIEKIKNCNIENRNQSIIIDFNKNLK
jgi:hypothetical protein